MKAVINEAVLQFNINEVILEVTYKNDKAFYLYKKMDFKEVDSDTGTPGSITLKYSMENDK
ncbi:hypothetical protein [Chryseobacterium sp.]|jgi:hypothetical protein|uniref:hypothetical protein n=1 Tax=Chryseobacterium sp. TaxID=1871047 RepID=UPI0028526D55|nr:hypothetical protein [Chryseobacterium sp.]